jgi:hypothetical protein
MDHGIRRCLTVVLCIFFISIIYRLLYIKPYIRNIFYSKFLYAHIYHTSNAMDIFYFYLIQCLKHKEKIKKSRENLYIERKPIALSILDDHLENAAGAYKKRNLLYI